MHANLKSLVIIVAAVGLPSLTIVAAHGAETGARDHMFLASADRPGELSGTHLVVFRGVTDVSGYNNHAYLARYDGRLWVIWSSSPRDGGHTGQQIRWSTSVDGVAWSESAPVTIAPSDGYFIARGLWVRNDELLALAARCRGEAGTTAVEALEAYRWNTASGAWEFYGKLGDEIINNYPPIPLDSGEWLVPYRYRELNRVDGVMVGGSTALDAWRRIPLPGNEQARFTESNAVVRGDGSIAVHFRDNQQSGRLFRSVSTDGGRSFSVPAMTDFPDCRCKHFCLRLGNGKYVLINNPTSRATLRLAVSDDGIVFTRSAVVRSNPSPVRNPGHDKSPSFTYPHALEHDDRLWIVYAANRDDIVVTAIPLGEIERIAR